MSARPKRDGRPPRDEESGVSADARAVSCYRAYRNAAVALGGDVPEPEDCDPETQANFVETIDLAVKTLEQMADDAENDRESTSTWPSLAEALYRHFYQLQGVEEIPEPGVLAVTAFEALARHTCNCLDWDREEGDIESHESWGDWARAKAQERGHVFEDES